MRGVACLAVSAVAVSAVAQQELSGRDQFPQFRTTSGLPGSGIPVNGDGAVGGYGAATISIPVAYSLRGGSWVGALSYAYGSMTPSFPRFQSGGKEFNGNGSAWIMSGFATKLGRITVSGMLLSSKLDNVANVLYTPRGQHGPLTVGLGVQDLMNTAGSSGQSIDLPQGGGDSRSLFAVGTWKFSDRLYASAGLGTRRFHFGFGGASYNVDRRWTLTAEHDGFNFNGGVIYNTGRLFDISHQPVIGNLTVGAIRGKYLFLMAAFGF